MKILVACEESGTIREAFKKKGHNAWSCDMLPSRIPGKHIQDDVRNHLNEEWDLIIAHPPCERLTVTANKWYLPKYEKRFPNIWQERSEAIKFFNIFTTLDIPKICIENPIGIMNTLYKKPSQIIQPFEFGDPQSKSTCLWLKGLPKLKPTKKCIAKRYRCACGRIFSTDQGKNSCCGGLTVPLWDNQTKGGHNNLIPSEHRKRDRSTTYQGIAQAMANQWGTLKEWFEITE